MKKILKQCLPTYEIVEKIGEGIHGSVYKVKDMFKERAVKIVPIQVERSKLYKTQIDLDSKVSQDFHAVREYYEKIRGDGVIQIFDFHLVNKTVSKNQAMATLIILMELCPFTLHEYILDIFPLKKESALKYMQALIDVLARISLDDDRKFLLTDFKPSNFLITADDKLVIGDLGGLKRLSSVSTIANAQFTPNWSAPELVLKGEKPTMTSAIYSFGLVCYFLWEAGLPYEEKDFTDRLNAIKEHGVSFDHPDIPPGLQTLIQQCLLFDPEKRPKTFGDIQQHFITIINNTETHEFTVGNISTTQALDEYRTHQDVQTPARPVLKEKTLVEDYTNMSFVWVEPGSFFPGNISKEKTGQAKSVDGFWIGIHPVTQWQWKRITHTNPSHFTEIPECPVEQISWKEAEAFCETLTQKSSTGLIFRIPTEVQWEYAARSGGNDERYPGGHDLSDCAWFKENSDMSTHPVGLKKANGLGIYDMAGNVQELCDDLTNPNIWEKIARGGAWNSAPEKCSTLSGRKISTGLRYTNTGLRVIGKLV